MKASTLKKAKPEKTEKSKAVKPIKIDLEASMVLLAEHFKEHGKTLYMVGGHVRNALLFLPSADLDVASKATPDQVMAFFKNSEDIKVIPKALDYGTVQIDLVMDGEKTSFEHTTFRKDFYHDGGLHRPSSVEFTDDILEDARRRDFTINALYYDILNHDLVDPLNGLKDLKAMTIRAAKENPEETLNDDGLRIMRMARFAAELNFKVDPKLFKAVKKYAHYLSDITPDRKQTELKKILLSDIKYEGFNGAFNASKPKRGIVILKESGALNGLISELYDGAGIGQNTVYHAHDVLMHGICTIAATPPDYALRLAGLLHDMGKPAVLKETGKMIGHDAVSEKMARVVLNNLRTPKAIIREATLLIHHHMFDLAGEAKVNTIKKKAGALGFNQFRKLIALRRADIKGSGKNAKDVSAARWEQVLEDMIKSKTPESIAELDIDGKALMEALDITEGKTLGELLKRLHARVLLNPKQNKREQLIVLARQILKEL